MNWIVPIVGLCAVSSGCATGSSVVITDSVPAECVLIRTVEVPAACGGAAYTGGGSTYPGETENALGKLGGSQSDCEKLILNKARASAERAGANVAVPKGVFYKTPTSSSALFKADAYRCPDGWREKSQ